MHSFTGNVRQGYTPLLRTNVGKSVLNYLLSELLHEYGSDWSPPQTVTLQKITAPQLLKKFPAFYRIQKFITALTTACILLPTLRQINPVCTLPTDYLKIHTLYSYLCLRLPSCLFRSGLPTKNLACPCVLLTYFSSESVASASDRWWDFLPKQLTLRRRIKSHLLFAGIIRSSPFSPR
jgi:hypothetical protein